MTLTFVKSQTGKQLSLFDQYLHKTLQKLIQQKYCVVIIILILYFISRGLILYSLAHCLSLSIIIYYNIPQNIL